jgi:hypothetical protein
LAPLMPASWPRTRFITVLSECASPLRSANGLSAEKMSPWFGAPPLKLKPITAKAPAGAWTTVMK